MRGELRTDLRCSVLKQPPGWGLILAPDRIGCSQHWWRPQVARIVDDVLSVLDEEAARTNDKLQLFTDAKRFPDVFQQVRHVARRIYAMRYCSAWTIRQCIGLVVWLSSLLFLLWLLGRGTGRSRGYPGPVVARPQEAPASAVAAIRAPCQPRGEKHTAAGQLCCVCRANPHTRTTTSDSCHPSPFRMASWSRCLLAGKTFPG